MISYEEPNNFRVGAKFGIYIYIGITAVSLCVAPFVFTSAPNLILPFSLLVNKPIIWIVLGVAFMAASGLTLSTAKPLLNMVKDSVQRKIQEKKGYVTLALEELDDKTPSNSNHHNDDETLAQQNLVNQVKKGNDRYWLQQHDIAHIARAVYGYSENPENNNIFFCIPGNVNSLNEGLKEYKNKVEQGIFTSIINLGDHWVTLFVSYSLSDKKYIAYYCDSFGNQLPNASNRRNDIELANKITVQQIEPLNTRVSNLISEGERNPDSTEVEEEKKNMKEALRCVREDKNKLVNKQINGYYIVAVLQETLGINDISSSQTQQQTDGYNCGVFALQNAKAITDMLIAGHSSNEITKELSRYKPNLKELNKIRIEFSNALENDVEWREDQCPFSREIRNTKISQWGSKKKN